jgi:hypothetical protein
MTSKRFSVFISWSDSPASEVALELQIFLQEVFTLQDFDFFVSANPVTGIVKGARVPIVLNEELVKSNFGILILTKNNYLRPWLMYEAGAVAKNDNSKVIPILFNRDKNQIEGPIEKIGFQYASLKKEEFEGVIISIFKAGKEKDTLEEREKNDLKDMLNKHWNSFYKKVTTILSKPECLTVEDLTDEMKLQTILLNEQLYEQLLSRRENFLEKLIIELKNNMSKRIIFFGGISTKIRDENTLIKLTQWLLDNRSSRLFICHEIGDAVRGREVSISSSAFEEETDKDLESSKELEVRKRKIIEFNEMKSNLYGYLGPKIEDDVKFIEIIKPLSIYIIIVGNTFYFTPVLEKRTSNTFTVKLKKHSFLL